MEFQGDVDENISVSGGNLSPDFGDTCRYGCPRSHDWDSDIDVWAGNKGLDEDNKEISEENTKGLRKVWEGPCCEGRWPFSRSLGCRGNAHDGPADGKFQVLHAHKARADVLRVVDFERDPSSDTEDGW